MIAESGKLMERIRDFTEEQLIDIISSLVDYPEESVVPFGDDAAAFKLNREAIVLTTDMLVSSTDILPGMKLRHVGRKIVVMNYSDLAAKGAKPLYFLCSMGIPRETPIKDFKELIKGINETAKHYDSFFVGGDLNRSDELILSGTAIGTVKPEKAMKRRGAKPEDIVAVTGFFGYTGAAYKILMEEKRGKTIEVEEKIVEETFKPRARVKEGIILSESSAVTSCIDSSDGLAVSLHTLAKINGVGFKIDHVPIAREVTEYAAKHGLSPIDLALYGGEEYELVFTVKPEKWLELEEKMREERRKIYMIGVTTKKQGVYVKEREINLRMAWRHFR